jgi:hypothetical protein
MNGDLHGSQQTRVVYGKAVTQHNSHVLMSQMISDSTSDQKGGRCFKVLAQHTQYESERDSQLRLVM